MKKQAATKVELVFSYKHSNPRVGYIRLHQSCARDLGYNAKTDNEPYDDPAVDYCEHEECKHN